MGSIEEHARRRAARVLEATIPQVQREFVMTGPLRGALPTDLRAEIIRVFTQVLSRAVVTGDGGELGRFVDNIVWEARKLGVAPRLFDAWIGRYAATVRRLLDDQEWSMTEPMLATAREHIERLQN